MNFTSRIVRRGEFVVLNFVTRGHKKGVELHFVDININFSPSPYFSPPDDSMKIFFFFHQCFAEFLSFSSCPNSPSLSLSLSLNIVDGSRHAVISGSSPLRPLHSFSISTSSQSIIHTFSFSGSLILVSHSNTFQNFYHQFLTHSISLISLQKKSVSSSPIFLYVPFPCKSHNTTFPLPTPDVPSLQARAHHLPIFG